MTDEELWGQVRAGVSEAFGQLFERHAQAVFAYCLRRTGTWAVAEDLVSVVFMETWRKRTSVTVEESLLPWLYTVALGVTRNHQRARTRYKAALGKVAPQHADDDHADDVARRVDAEARTREVIAELEKLPAGEREVLEMSAWSDLSQTQIAQVLGIPVGTVKSRLTPERPCVMHAGWLRRHFDCSRPQWGTPRSMRIPVSTATAPGRTWSSYVASAGIRSVRSRFPIDHRYPWCC